MDNNYKITLLITYDTHAVIAKLANYFGVNENTLIRFLIYEAVEKFDYDKKLFKREYKNKGDFVGKPDSYSEIKRYQYQKVIKISQYLYQGIKRIRIKYPGSESVIIKNIINMSLNYYQNHYKEYRATGHEPLKDVTTINERYSINLSNLFNIHLENLADIIGISTNKLVSLILSKYLMDHDHILIDYFNEKIDVGEYRFW